MLVSSSYRTSNGVIEQIDGAIRISCRIFLLEVKWAESEHLAESDLYAFMGKVNTKLPGTLGLFVSYNELSQNFLNAMRNGQRQTCIVIHGPDNIKKLIDGSVDIKAYLTYFYEIASTKGIVELSVSDYAKLDLQNSINSSGTVATTMSVGSSQSVSWSLVLKDLCLDQVSVNDFGKTYSSSDFKGLSDKVVSVFPYLQYKDYSKYKELLSYCDKKELANSFLNYAAGSNLKKLLKPNMYDGIEFNNRNYFSSVFISYIEPLKLDFKDLNSEVDKYVDVLVNLLNEEKGFYENENVISRYVELVLTVLNQEQQMKLANPYFDIFIDDYRKEKSDYDNHVYENKKVAKEVINLAKQVDGFRERIVEPVVKEKLCVYDDSFYKENDESSVSLVMRKYGMKLREVGVCKSEVEEMYKNLK